MIISFVNGKSCFTDLIQIFEEGTKKLAEGSEVDVVKVDF